MIINACYGMALITKRLLIIFMVANNAFLLSSILNITFNVYLHRFFTSVTAAGVVPCGGPKKSPRTSSIVQVIFCFWSFEISEDNMRIQ